MCISIAGTGLDVYQSQFLELHQRLLFAEKENQKRSYELNSVLNEIKRVVDSIKWKLLSVTNGLPVHLTNIQYYLPHLQQHEDGIYPNVVIGQGRSGVSLVMGIPTVRRPKKTYLMDTLNSLFYEMSMKQKNDCVIVIFVAEVDTEYVNSVAENVRSSFPNEVLSGALEVISPPASYYPQLSNLKETFGDSKDRVSTVTKKGIIVVGSNHIIVPPALFLYFKYYRNSTGCHRGKKQPRYSGELEDDIIAKPDYIQIIKDFAKQQSSNDWMILEFSQLGFIGKLFRSRDLPLIVEFFLMFHKDKPIDWLLDHLLWVKVCSPEKDAKHCERQKAYLRISYKPSLFQHVGLHSSLAGKIQNLKDKDFGKSRLFKAHDNPSAKVSTSLKVFQHFTLEKAYKGAECFWAFAPVAGDYILFSFFQPLKIERYFFRSGNMEHPGDKLVNTTVEVLPADKTNLQLAKDNMQNFKRTQDGYLQIGAFENGIADGKISPSIGKIHALRLSVHSSSPMWALLSEIFLKT
uniref:Uncharacterized protein n=1 Tax=Sphaerodactylus townsendi TaxID=933632 RepID=A0ACB8E8A5_9SAUR